MAEVPPLMKPAVLGAAVGDSASATALGRLGVRVGAAPAKGVQQALRAALADLRAGRREAAAAGALKALDIDERNGLAWHILAICREKEGDFTVALQAYEQALALMPDEPEIANDLGRLALKMNMAPIAERLFANYVSRRPDSAEGINNLACAQRDLMRFDDAIDTLRSGLEAHPQSALLWNALGAVLTLQGRMEPSLTFYDEALRLDPTAGAAYYNRSIARLALGDAAGALADLEAAARRMALAGQVAGMKVARAKALVASGDLAAGWDAYEARLDPAYEDYVQFPTGLPDWDPQTPLSGRRLLLIGEQGLGDEVLFGHVLPDLIEAVGPDGALALAVDHRLTALFQRSFPSIEVGAHASGRAGHTPVRTAPFVENRLEAFDAFAPLGAPLRRFRRTAESFGRGAFLRADPGRTEHWRAVLAALPGLKVGVLWKSLLMDAERIRQFAPFAAWEPILAVGGVTFVNLQYGDSDAETAQTTAWGGGLWRPPGIDLKDDLDDLAALTCALDLTLGPANATTNIAGACGADVWLISTPGAWPRLGLPDYPWYPNARVFTPQTYAEWGPVMAQIALALAARAGA